MITLPPETQRQMEEQAAGLAAEIIHLWTQSETMLGAQLLALLMLVERCRQDLPELPWVELHERARALESERKSKLRAIADLVREERGPKG